MESAKRSPRIKATSLIVAATAAAALGSAAAPLQAHADDARVDDGTQANVQTAADAGATATAMSTQQAAGDASAADAQAGNARESGSQAGVTSDAATADAGAATNAAHLDGGTNGTYEENNIYQVTVRYVDADGQQIAPSFQKELAEGASWSASSPTVEGYALADESQAVVSGTAAGDDHNPVVTVTYESVLCTYEVVSELQVGDDYRVSKVVEREAPVGTEVSAAPEDIDGYHCVTGAADRSVVVTAQGTAQIVLLYDQDVPSYDVFYETGGSYVAPQTGHADDVIVIPDAPSKPGYTFAGWDLNGDGAVDPLPATMPDRNIQAQAVWTPAQAQYQVQYYIEESGDEYGGPKRYELRDTRMLTGTTESMTPAADRLDTSEGATWQYYQYARETSAPIAGDGTTVVKVYYDLKPVTVRYFVLFDGRSSLDSDELMETRTLNMYQTLYVPDDDAALALYKQNGGSKTSFREWLEYYSGLGVVEGSERLLPQNVAFDDAGNLECYVYALFANEVTPVYIFKNYEGVTAGDYSHPDAPLTTHEAGDYHLSTSTYADKPFIVYEWRCSESLWDGKDPSKIVWGPWHEVDDSYLSSSGLYRYPSPTTNFDITKENVFETRYARRAYTVTYYSNGREIGSSVYRYGAAFTVGDGVDVSQLQPHDGLVFAGWGKSPDAASALSGSSTMPGGNYALYVLWKRPDVTAAFETTGGSPVDSQTIAWEGKATMPAAPTRDGYEFGGWYYFGDGSTTPARFSFDQPLEHDIVLYASWKSAAQPTAYTVIHQTSDGTVLARNTYAGLVGETVTAVPLGANDPVRAGYRYVSSAGYALDLTDSTDANTVTFVYAKDPSYAYLVRAVDAATGQDIADVRCVLSPDAVVDVFAPTVDGWKVRGTGTGYLGSQGSREAVFLYDRAAVPAEQETSVKADGSDSGAHESALPARLDEAAAPAAEQTSAAQTLPATGDAPWTPFAVLAAAASALIGFLARRRKNESSCK